MLITPPPTVAKGTSIQLSAIVVDAAPGVTWAVEGGDTFGTVTTDGVYTAPSVVPDGPVVVRATSTADPRGTAATTVRVIVGAALERRPNAPVQTGSALASTFSGGQRSVAVSGSLVYFVWSENQSRVERVYLSASRDRGRTLGDPVLMSPADAGSYRYPSVGTDGSGRAVVAWVGSADGVFAAYAGTVTLDASGSVIAGPIQRLATMGAVGDPVVALAVDRQGVAYFAWTAEQGVGGVSDTEVLLARGEPTTDGTFTLSTPVPASAVSLTHQIRPAIAVNDAGDLVVAWNDTRDDLLGSNDVWWRRAQFANGAFEFVGEETRVNSELIGEQVSASVAVDRAGKAAIVWSDGRTTERRHVYFARSEAADLAVTANVPVVGVAIDADQNFPSVAIDPDGSITVAFADNRKCVEVNPVGGCQLAQDGTGPTDIYLVRSVDGGQSFGPVPNLKVSDDPETQILQHGRPSVAVDDVGRAFVLWTDDREGVSRPYMSRVD